jgi:hypothetical protein
MIGRVVATLTLSIMASTAAAESSLTSLVQQVQRCWKIPYGEPPAKVSMRVKLTRDGSIQGKPEVLSTSPNGRFAAAAVQAILECAPYAAVKEHPEARDIIFNFDPSELR